MADKTYTMTLNAAQLYALKSAFDANFAIGIEAEEAEASKAELQVHAKLLRLDQKRRADVNRAKALEAHAKATDWKPRMSPANRERMLEAARSGKKGYE